MLPDRETKESRIRTKSRGSLVQNAGWFGAEVLKLLTSVGSEGHHNIEHLEGEAFRFPHFPQD